MRRKPRLRELLREFIYISSIDGEEHLEHPALSFLQLPRKSDEASVGETPRDGSWGIQNNILFVSAGRVCRNCFTGHLTIWELRIHRAIPSSAALLGGLLLLISSFAQAATYTFVQSSWSGGTSATTAVHPTNQTSWDKYASKDSNVSAGASVALTQSSYSTTTSTQGDFALGTFGTTTSTAIGDGGISLQMPMVTPPIYSASSTVVADIIRPSCTGYSNCYTSLSSWEAQNADLVSLAQVRVVRIEGLWGSNDSTATTISGWTTDQDHFIYIYTDGQSRHVGLSGLDSGGTRITSSANYVLSGALTIPNSNVTVEGLVLSGGTASVTGSNVILKNNFFKNTTLAYSGGSTGAYLLVGNIFYDNGSASSLIETSVSSHALSALNNTLYGSGAYGFRASSGTITAKNNIVQGVSTAGYSTNGGSFGSSNYNISNKASDAPGANSINSATVSFVNSSNAGNMNLHLASGDTVAKNAGVSLSSDADFYKFGLGDIDSQTRETSWDIGADEYSTDRSFGAHGATSVLRPSCTGYSNCYTTLTSWEAQNLNLVTSARPEILRIEGRHSASTESNNTLSGWTTASTTYMYLYTAPEARHNGRPFQSGEFQISNTSTDRIFSINTAYTILDGLQASSTSSASPIECAISNCVIKNSILYGSGGSSAAEILMSSATGSVDVLQGNILIAGGPGSRRHFSINSQTGTPYSLYLYGNTTYGTASFVIRSSGGSPEIYAKNVIGHASQTTDAWNTPSLMHSSSNYNTSNDTTAGDAPGANSQSNVTPSFSNTGTHDFHLSTGDTIAKNTGTPLTSGTNGTSSQMALFDIDGEARGSTWDIGADEESTNNDLRTGTFESGTIDTASQSSFTTLSWTATVPTGGTLQFQVAANNTNSSFSFLGPDGTANTYYTSSGSSMYAGLSGNRYVRWKAFLNASSTASSPILNDVTINYDQYTNGTLTSSKYDSGDTGNLVNMLSWTGSGTTSTRVIKFQARSASSAGGLDSAAWCGYADASAPCSGSNYFDYTKSGVAVASNNPLRSGGDDRYFQYKVFFETDGGGTGTLNTVTVQYVVNAPPDFDSSYGTNGVSVSQDTTSSNSTYGKVLVSYKIRDTDTSSGTVNSGYVTPSFEYNIGGGWVAVQSAYLAAGDTSNKAVSGGSYTTYTATWDAKSQLGAQYTTTAQVRVTVNDNEAANNTAVATGNSFTLDTTNPAAGTFRIDASSATSTIILALSDNSTIASYVLSNASDFSGASTATTTVNASSLSTTYIAWTPVATTTQTVYVKVLDTYNNILSTSVVAPGNPSTFDLQDVSNVTSETYREFVAWPVYSSATGATFSKYEVWRSTDGSTYSLLTTVTDSAQNYYLDSSVSSTTTYYYKVRYADTDTDKSNYSSAASDRPDGQGGTDTVSPTLSSVATSEIKNTSVRITWDTNELSTSEVNYGTTVSYGSTQTSSSYVTSGHSVYLTGLSANTTYYYRVKSTDISGNIGTNDNNGSSYTFTTAGGPIISNVTTESVNDNSATIFWNTTTDSNSYVRYSLSSNLSSYTEVGSSTLVGGSAPFQHRTTITGLTAGTTYYFNVKSTDAGSNTTIQDNGGSAFSFVTTSDQRAPVLSSIQEPVVSSTQAVIVWISDELSTSQVEFGTTAGVSSGNYASTTGLDSTRTIYHVVALSGLTAQTNYYYRVKSADAAGNTGTSDENTFTTTDEGEVRVIRVGSGASVARDTDTTAPTIEKIDIKNVGSFDATVEVKTNEEAYAFIEYGETASYGSVVASPDPLLARDIKLVGLKLGTPYNFRVKAVDRAGNISISSNQILKTKFLAESLEDLTILERAEQVQSQLEEIIQSALPSILPPFIESPKIINVAEDSADVVWRTNVKAYGTLSLATDEEFKKQGEYPTDISGGEEKGRDHAITLSNLKPNTKYHIMVKSHVFPEVPGKSADIAFVTKAAKVEARISDVKNDSFRALWTSLEPTSSIVEYVNKATGVANKKTDEKATTVHDMLVDNLTPGTTFSIKLYGTTANETLIEAKEEFTITTGRDTTPPSITVLKVDSALLPGRQDRIQTVVSWKTNEPATSLVAYEEGSASPDKKLANKADTGIALSNEHAVILSNLKAGAIYRIQVTSTDEAGNTTTLPVRTIITPRQNESIVDVIFKNFEDTFQFVKNIR